MAVAPARSKRRRLVLGGQPHSVGSLAEERRLLEEHIRACREALEQAGPDNETRGGTQVSVRRAEQRLSRVLEQIKGSGQDEDEVLLMHAMGE